MRNKQTCIACVLVLALSAAVALAQAASPAQQPASAEPTALIAALPGVTVTGPAGSDQTRIAREVRHELVMLYNYTIWDFLAFRMNGNTVDLYGDVTNSQLASDAEKAVKRIEGVEKVVNHINVLPVFPSDDRIRRAVARSIFDFGGLSRYSWSAVPSLHIIVGAGHVKLEGIVDSQADKNAAFIRASGVEGVFDVQNELIVAKQ